MKKTLSILCVLMMLISLFSVTITANAAVDGLTLKAVFKGYTTQNIDGDDYNVATIDVEVAYPRTFVAYSVTGSLKKSYKGDFIQTAGFDFNIDNENLMAFAATTASTSWKTNDNLNKIYFAETEKEKGYSGASAFTVASISVASLDNAAAGKLTFTGATTDGMYYENNTAATFGYSMADFTITNCDIPSYEAWLASQGGGSEEPAEEFDVDVEGTATTTSVAFFAKNTSGADLAAGTYGVIFGGVKFAAGVNPDTNCLKDEKFVVKFVVDDGDSIEKGIYNYQAYYNNGANVSAEKTVEIK